MIIRLKYAKSYGYLNELPVSRENIQFANHAISGEIFGKLSRFPRSEIFYPTLVHMHTQLQLVRIKYIQKMCTEQSNTLYTSHVVLLVYRPSVRPVPGESYCAVRTLKWGRYYTQAFPHCTNRSKLLVL